MRKGIKSYFTGLIHIEARVIIQLYPFTRNVFCRVIQRCAIWEFQVNIARNISIDKTRSKDFRNSSKTEDIENNVLSIDKRLSTAINPETLVLKDLVNKLKPEQKIILELVYFRGFTHVEAAEELDIPLGTVKTRLRNAIIN